MRSTGRIFVLTVAIVAGCIDGLDSGDSGDTDCESPSDWYPDVDGDGFGAADAAVSACEQPKGTLATAGDCDDRRADVNPDAEERCGDGLDNDCSGLSDCEEDACTFDDTCFESDCDDGLDEDDDGLADCEDEDCWSDGCGAWRARVTGGRSHTKHEILDWTSEGYDTREACKGDFHTDTVTADLSSITGTLQVLTFSGGIDAECAWSLSHATVKQRAIDRWRVNGYQVFIPTYYGHNYDRECYPTSTTSTAYSDLTVTRSGFSIEPGCGTSGSDFLPDTLQLQAGAALIQPWLFKSAVWYGGAPSRWSSYTTSEPLFWAFESGYYFGSWLDRSYAYWDIPTVSGTWREGP